MPKSPVVNFNIQNNNVEVSTPLNGVSQIVAVTSKGKVGEPDILVRTLQEFRREFGYELVPDGTVSNAEAALRGGSILRLSRVEPDLVTTQQSIFPFTRLNNTTNVVETTVDPDGTNSWVFDFMGLDGKHTYLSLKAKNTDDGFDFSSIGLNLTINQEDVFSYALRTKYNQITEQVVLQILNQNLGSSIIDYNDDVVLEIPLPKEQTDIDTFLGTLSQYFIVDIATTLPLEFTNSDLSDITTLDALSSYVKLNPMLIAMGTGIIDTAEPTEAEPIYYQIGEANGNGTGTMVQVGVSIFSTKTDNVKKWENAFNALGDYDESYQFILSHVHQHLTKDTDELNTLYRDIRNQLETYQDIRLFIEIPKENITDIQITDWLNKTIASVGESKWVAYFGGGLKYYGNKGKLQNCDVLGTVLGLADSSATTSGQWYHFSGLNRGIVTTATGIVANNYGTPSRYSQINSIGLAKGNMSVIKDTPGFGRQVVQWHNFTSQAKNDSFKFLGTVGLVLYIKKNFRPILNSFLEEPNTFITWSTMYYRLLPIISDLVSRMAITDDWNYYGDQFATSYSDLEVNNEADVRQGKYKAQFIFKDIIAMQEITMDLTIDAATGIASVSVQ